MMRVKAKVLSVVVLLVLLCGPAMAAPSLDIDKGPVLPDPSSTGPLIDPEAIQGQWFEDVTTGNETVRTHEFHDNADLGGWMSYQAIEGIVTVIQYDSVTVNIIGFQVRATITNDLPNEDDWLPGDNSHGEWAQGQLEYEGTLYDTKLTAEFAVPPLPVALLPGNVDPYRDTQPHIVASNHDQLGWYCWTPDNGDDALLPWGNYYVPTWDFGDIPLGGSASRTLIFTVEAPGLDATDLRHFVIEESFFTDTDILLNRTTSLKISTWQDDPALDFGMAYPHQDGEPPLRSSDCSVFHNIEGAHEEAGGLSLDIRKPPVGPLSSWTGPPHDPDALLGQWFERLDGTAEEVRTHEFYDPTLPDAAGSAHWAIHGQATNIQYDAVGGGNIIAFDIVATINNWTPWPYDWQDGSNSHDEWLSTDQQYEGALLDVKLTAEFSLDPLKTWPWGPGVAPDPPYRETMPWIIAENHDQLGWYCWTPENPYPHMNPWGDYLVPTWDFGDIPQYGSATRTMSFTVLQGGLNPNDLRALAIEDSAANGTDILLNRSTSLKISTWVDDLYADIGIPYPHEIDPGLPLRSSDCSVFHNIEEEEPIEGGLSLPVTKPPLEPVSSWTGPLVDPDAVQGQWFERMDGTEEVRTHEFYDPVEADNPGVPTHLAIMGVATNVQTDAVNGNIISFDIIATISNGTPWPYGWIEDGNSHDEWTNPRTQYAGTLFETKLTAEFALDPNKTWPWGPGITFYPPYRETMPWIIAENHDQLGWYCWTPDNPYPHMNPWGDYLVPTWDFGDIPQGSSATRTMSFVVWQGGLNPLDVRAQAIFDSELNGTDILLNRTTSLKISTWVDDLYKDDGTPYPHFNDPGLPLRSSDCSVFHNIEEEPPPEEGGLSLPVTKPPLTPMLDAWTGPMQDPDAILGQWFLDIVGGAEEPRSHEYYDPVEAGHLPTKSAASAIFGYATNVQYDALMNIVAFDIEATITNLTPWPYGWLEDGNSHDERTATRQQYEGTLYDTKLTGEFAVDILTGLGGLPPAGALYPPYRDTQPHICAQNHDQLGWYCWTPGNPYAEKSPWGNYYVPTWDFGDIPPGVSSSRTLKFTVDLGGLPPVDPRYAVIQTSEVDQSDILLNRTTSLKISTWIDDLYPDNAVPYPHQVNPGLPLRSSDCSVFHNIEPTVPDVGGLSLWVTKPEVLPFSAAWTGPQIEPDSVAGQWFYDMNSGVEDFRTNEFYDPSVEFLPGLFIGSSAIHGRAVNVQYDPTSNNIIAFDIDATITNLTPWPFEWIDGNNSHGESLSTTDQYAGTLYDTKLTAEFAINLGGPLPPGNIPPYQFGPVSLIRALNNDQLGWYCWTPDNPHPDKFPWGQYMVPTWDFGDIPQGGSATRLLSFQIGAPGLTPLDLRYAVIQDSELNGTDILLNRTTSLKISTWIDDLASDTGLPYPHLVEDMPLRSSDVSVFHNTEPRIPIAATLDWDWVYKNAPVTLGWVHKSILTITVGPDPLGNTIYSSMVTVNPASTGLVYPVATVNPLVWEIRGGQHGVDPKGMVQLDVTVYGMDVGGQGKTISNIKVRPLGDIDDNGGVEPGDSSMLVMKLNGIPPVGIPDPRAFDLDGNGGAEPADFAIMTNVLNGVPIP